MLAKTCTVCVNMERRFREFDLKLNVKKTEIKTTDDNMVVVDILV